jgi:Amt family ammonium transporter
MDPGNAAWVLASAALVLFMTPGLALFYGGMDQSRNVLNMLMMNFYCLLIVPIVWVVVGFSLSYSGDGSVIGNLDWAFLNDLGITGDTNTTSGSTLLAVAYLGMFAVITPALISGAVAGRMKFSAWAIFVPLWILLVYCPVGFWVYGGVWGDEPLLTGWLGERGSLDFAGGTVIHVNAGIAALAAVFVLGKRKGWPRDIQPPHSMPLVMIGTGILWFGWFGFNAGSALAASEQAALAFATTNTASAAAALAWIAFDVLRRRKASALGACIGAVVGLVAITPAAGYVSVAQSIVIGTVSSIISNVAVHWKTRSTLDDTLDVFPCHGVGGMVGMIATGVFAAEVGLIHGETKVFFVQLLTLAIAAPYAFAGSWILFKVTDAIIPLRVSERQEQIGLDITQHDETVSTRGVRAAVESMQGELFGGRET